MSASLVEMTGWLYILISGLKFNVFFPLSITSKSPLKSL